MLSVSVSLLTAHPRSLGFAATTATAKPPSTVPAPDDLETLMREFAASGVVRARFRETRHLSLLAAPLELKGVLYFAPPDRLARFTTQPTVSSVVVRDGRVAMRDDRRHRVLRLAKNDVVRDVVGSFLTLLSGDLEALRDRYTLRYRAHETAWTLDLEPRSRASRRVLSLMRFEGQGFGVTAMEKREPNGDTTRTVFEEVETRVELDPAALERIFSLENPTPTP
jgi:hypothetical protein